MVEQHATSSFDAVVLASQSDGTACFDLGPRWTVLTAGEGVALTEAEAWPRAVRGMLPRRPGPRWSGGVVGWIGYEAGSVVETMPSPKVRDLAIPDLCLWRVEGFLIHDRWTGNSRIAGTGAFREQARAWLHAAMAAPPRAPSPGRTEGLSGDADTRAAYVEGVRTILAAIREGDVYQANLAWRHALSLARDPLETWLVLRSSNPAERGAYLQKNGVRVISNSPELFLRVRRNGRRRFAWSTPIKGTASLADGTEGLEASEKERSELTMIVDLVRNDLGRVARTGTVRHDLRTLRRCGDLWHAEQRVTAELGGSHDAVDAFAASFPPGSVTGAPKVAAMDLIGRLEPVRRGVYCGALGFFGDDGDAHWNVAIRTATVSGNRAWFHVGAGIVADSDPEREWAETLAKGARLADALAGA